MAKVLTRDPERKKERKGEAKAPKRIRTRGESILILGNRKSTILLGGGGADGAGGFG